MCEVMVLPAIVQTEIDRHAGRRLLHIALGAIGARGRCVRLHGLIGRRIDALLHLHGMGGHVGGDLRLRTYQERPLTSASQRLLAPYP